MTALNAPLVRRIVYAVLLIATAVLGLATRSNARHLPLLFVTYAPDVLWAFLVFALVVVLAPRLSSKQAGAAAFGFALFMECSQLYQAAWVNSLRATAIGGLLLGFGFLWSDIACYAAGVGLGVLVDCAMVKLSKRDKAA